MDYSMKVPNKSGSSQGNDSEPLPDAESPVSSVDVPESSYPCPACPIVLSSSRELTNHLRGHNSPRSTDYSGEEDYSCGVCNKVLSSASSLDRHVLVHSGERPFKCRHCANAFTTNGNMNRHLRTAHRSSASPLSCTDSEVSSDSDRPRKCRRIEDNNNDIAKRKSPNHTGRQKKMPTMKRKVGDCPSDNETYKKHKILLNNARTEIKLTSDDIQNIHKCSVCGRQDFATSALLEAHLERNHPEFPAKCEPCNLSFKNHRVLNLHRFMVHFAEDTVDNPARNLRNSVVGFNDLTFVDFSSDKFPTIARAACEKSLHRPASGEVARFQCCKCLRAFPCRSALDAHESDCGTTSQARVIGDNPSMRDDFFAGLDLQNKAAMAEAKEGKDLADIQSIISVTSGPILQNFPRSDASTPESTIKFNQSLSSSGSSGTFSSEYVEEVHDSFAAEFRKMKMKGEFPCRLCTMIFPNLRALKGHNRTHMSAVPSGLPYPCNMCPYTSTDKATMVRHLRSHNGDRPYECTLCRYAFTTKANCERHVRNRHGKMSREEVKSSLAYHPYDEATPENVGRGSPRIKDEARKSLMYNEHIEHPPQVHYPSVSMESHGEIRIIEEAKLHTGYENAEYFPRPGQQAIEMTRNPDDGKSGDYTKHEDDLESRSSEGSVSLVSEDKSDSHQRMQASPMNLKKGLTVSESASEDGPLDLSMDVLDLSKKSKGKEEGSSSSTQGHYGNSQKELYDAARQFLLAGALLKAGQVTTHDAQINGVFPNSMFYNQYANDRTPRVLTPYLFEPHVLSQQYALKERLKKSLARGLQLTSGGSLVEPSVPTTERFNAYPQAHDRREMIPQPVNDQNDYVVPTNVSNKGMTCREEAESHMQSSNSVKMVIKNGVLMPKQKQRRYRTERPFSCEHCSARFTLRSNMERHIKQQHPQHWSQRPRGGNSTRGRPPTSHPTLVQNLSQPEAQVPQTFPNILPKAEMSAEYSRKHSISDQVKYAILAQQLKANKTEENDTDEELVIDEGVQEKEQESQKEKCTSLLRGQLEGSETVKETIDEPEECVKSESTNTESANSDNANDELKISDLEQSMEASEHDDTKPTFKHDLADEKAEKVEDGATDLASVSELLDNASQQFQQFQPQYLSDEEGLVASNSDCNNSGSDEKSDSVNSIYSISASSKKIKKKKKKKSAYSLAPNRVICPFCERPFPWTSSLRRHILTHTGQKPFQCVHCSLLFTTKSNCDRHLLRKHKTNPDKIRSVRNSSSPDNQTVINNNNSFSMRNVPERPYKCNQCPSSTFSTLGNLKKHRSTKHGHKAKSRSDTPSSEPQNSPQECSKQNEQMDYDSQSSSVSESTETTTPVSEVLKSNLNTSLSTNDMPRSKRPSPRSSPGPNDVPFKCHLCDSGFSDRQDCLDHIKANHEKSYEMLVQKGALDMDIDTVDDQQQPPPPHHPSDGEEKKGRFPDYSNRKVVCAFCMRRFWSAEDLRRHMRTHTGERPFSCDICYRRFTLKHSMLRHRKKHESVDSAMYVGTSGDEENSPSHPPNTTRSQQHQQQPAMAAGTSGNPRTQDRISLPTVAPGGSGDAVPSGLARFNHYESRPILAGHLNSAQQRTRNTSNNPQHINPETSENADTDLISNLLGIPDKLIDRVLQASADDAAKLLGVKHSH